MQKAGNKLKSLRAAALCVIFVMAASFLMACSASPKPRLYIISGLSLPCKLSLYASADNGYAASLEVKQYLLKFENEITTRQRYEAGQAALESTVYKLNNNLNKSGQPEFGALLEVSANFKEMFNYAVEAYQATGGIFNVAILPAIKLWKLDFEEIEIGETTTYKPSASQIEEVAEYCKLSYFSITESEGRYYISKSNPNAELDFGALAKGFVCQEIAQIFSRHNISGGAFDYAGSSLYIYKTKPKNKQFLIDAENPVTGKKTAPFYVKDAAVSTSNNSGRYYLREESGGTVRVGHILDGRTFCPVQTDVESVTVIDASGARGEVYSTTLMCHSVTEALQIANSLGLKVVLIDNQGAEHANF